MEGDDAPALSRRFPLNFSHLCALLPSTTCCVSGFRHLLCTSSKITLSQLDLGGGAAQTRGRPALAPWISQSVLISVEKPLDQNVSKPLCPSGSAAQVGKLLMEIQPPAFQENPPALPALGGGGLCVAMCTSVYVCVHMDMPRKCWVGIATLYCSL